MKRVIMASRRHLFDDPSLPEIPSFEDFKEYFTLPSAFGKQSKRDLRLHKTWKCELYNSSFRDLLEEGLEKCWYGCQEFLDENCFWYLAKGNNGWYGLAVFDKEYGSYNEYRCADSFETCLNTNRKFIENWMEECAYSKYKSQPIQSATKSSWCQDMEGDVVYEGDKLVDQEGWEWVVDKIHEDGTVDLSLLDDNGTPVEEHWGEYSTGDIKREFTII